MKRMFRSLLRHLTCLVRGHEWRSCWYVSPITHLAGAEWRCVRCGVTLSQIQAHDV
jgi:hypothetical protein